MRLHRLALLALLALIALPARAQEPLRIIAFGAHPDDCDIRSGGVAAKWAAAGHKVRFVAVTNGDAGHHEEGGGQLAMRRRAEAIEAGRRIGVDYVVLDNHDGELVPSLDVRQQIIRQIREWKADLVLAPRPERLPSGPPLHRRAAAGCGLHGHRAQRGDRGAGPEEESGLPVTSKMASRSRRRSGPTSPCPSTTSSTRKSTRSTPTCRRSTSGSPGTPARSTRCRRTRRRARRGSRSRACGRPLPRCARPWSSGTAPRPAAKVQVAEAFEICEYGTRPDEAMLRRLFPFLPQRSHNREGTLPRGTMTDCIQTHRAVFEVTPPGGARRG